MRTLKNLLFLLNTKERSHAAFLMVMILIMAFLDTLGVASILPFIAVLGNPDLINTNNLLNAAFKAVGPLGVVTTQHFLFALGVLVFITLLVSLTFKALITYLQAHFVQMREYSIGRRLVEGYLHQPYSWFLNRNSSDLGKNILSEVEEVVGAGLSPMMVLITQSVLALALVTLLVFIDPQLALIVGITLSLSYTIIYRFMKNFIKRLGVERLDTNHWRFNAVNEAFGAIKEIKIGGLENTYIERFAKPAKIFAYNKALIQVISQVPRYFLEAIAFGGMLLLVLFLMSKNNGLTNALPIIALYAFAGYRMMPATQLIYTSVSQLRFISPAIDSLKADLNGLKLDNLKIDRNKFQLNKDIKLRNIHYSYPNASRKALKNIQISIPVYSTVGLVGATGSGKTTTVDIILGLLEAQDGSLEVDGEIINKKNIRSWQRSIGYVPQQIYLADDTVAANIAFGSDPKDIDIDRVKRVSKIAKAHEFISNELPSQYQTSVGERGVRLSGGQRQRIGIARALYYNPKVLIFDEATSALDNLTEKEVMQAMHSIKKKITVILIAHRLSTVKECDIIYLLDAGELKGQGTFDQLQKTNNYFRMLSQSM